MLVLYRSRKEWCIFGGVGEGLSDFLLEKKKIALYMYIVGIYRNKVVA